MTNEYMIRFIPEADGRSPYEIYNLLTITYDALQVRKPEAGGSPSMVQPNGEDQPKRVDLYVTLVADNDDEIVEAAKVTMSALTNFGLKILGSPELRSCRPVKRMEVRTAGVVYDQQDQSLTIDTWAPDWKDLELTTWSSNGQTFVLIADYESGRRIEQSAKTSKIIVRRPGGMPPPGPQRGLL